MGRGLEHRGLFSPLRGARRPARRKRRRRNRSIDRRCAGARRASRYSVDGADSRDARRRAIDRPSRRRTRRGPDRARGLREDDSSAHRFAVRGADGQRPPRAAAGVRRARHVREPRAPRRDRIGRARQRRDRSFRRHAIRPRHDHRTMACAGVRERRRQSSPLVCCASSTFCIRACRRGRSRALLARVADESISAVQPRVYTPSARGFGLAENIESRWLAEAVSALLAVAAGAPSSARGRLATLFSHAVSTWIPLIATPGTAARRRPDSGARRADGRDDTGTLVKHGQPDRPSALSRAASTRPGTSSATSRTTGTSACTVSATESIPRYGISTTKGSGSSSSPSIAPIRCGRTTCPAYSPCGAITCGGGARRTTSRRRSRTCGWTWVLARAPRSRRWASTG